MRPFPTDFRPSFPVPALVLLALAAVLLLGCDNTVDILDRETGLYSIYGALNLDAEVNYVRVKDLNTPLVEDSTRTFGATVTMKNLRTGTSEVLRDSVVPFENVYTHNFRTTLDILPDTEYRITIEHPDGRTTRATATTPPIAETNAVPEGVTCQTSLRVLFEPVASRNAVRAKFGVDYQDQRRWTGAIETQLSSSNPDLAFLRVTPKEILDAIFKPRTRDGKEVWCYQLASNIIYVRYTHFGPDFEEPPPSDSLGVPVRIGQFGGYYEDAFSFLIDTTKVCTPIC